MDPSVNDKQEPQERVARFKVSMELLRQVLHMPNGSTIVHVNECETWGDQGTFWVTVMSPELPMASVFDPPEVFPTTQREQITWHWNLNVPCTEES